MCRRLELATDLARCFVSVSQRSQLEVPLQAAGRVSCVYTSATDVDLHAMPSRVRSHYVKLLLDWSVSALTKANSKSFVHAGSEGLLQQLRCKWQLLFILLTSVHSPAQAAPNTTLVLAATTACKSCSKEQASSEDGHQLAVAMQQAILALNIKFKHTFRPSLEHR